MVKWWKIIKIRNTAQDYYNIRLLKRKFKWKLFQPYPIFATTSTVLKNNNLMFGFLGNFVIEVIYWKFDNVKPC